MRLPVEELFLARVKILPLAEPMRLNEAPFKGTLPNWFDRARKVQFHRGVSAPAFESENIITLLG
jgi:hypothetical protein